MNTFCNMNFEKVAKNLDIKIYSYLSLGSYGN